MVLPGARPARRRVVDVERTETEKIRIGLDVDNLEVAVTFRRLQITAWIRKNVLSNVKIHICPVSLHMPHHLFLVGINHHPQIHIP
jgi:hypothetical protein